jgi:hypothetical protein
MSYRDIDCPQCGRSRVLLSGVCEKCRWDMDNQKYILPSEPLEPTYPHLLPAEAELLALLESSSRVAAIQYHDNDLQIAHKARIVAPAALKRLEEALALVDIAWHLPPCIMCYSKDSECDHDPESPVLECDCKCHEFARRAAALLKGTTP